MKQKHVQIATIIGLAINLGMLLVGTIIAVTMGNSRFNMVDNVISDLGRIEYTPFPFTRLIANVGGCVFLIPLVLHLHEKLLECTATPGAHVASKISAITFLTGLVAMASSGTITLDVSRITHGVLAGIAVISLCTTGIILGILGIIRAAGDIVTRALGWFMLIVPPVMAVLFIGECVPPSGEFYEWMLFFSLQAWIIGISVRLFGPPPTEVPRWWRPFRLFGRTLMFLFFLVVVLAPFAAILLLWDEISSPVAMFDFFGAWLPVSTIMWILSTICLTFGTFGLVKSIEMIVKAIKKVRFKLTWKPIGSALVLVGIVVGALFYYMPFWYLNLGIKPTFGPHVAIHGDGGMQVSWDTTRASPSIVMWGTSRDNLTMQAEGGEFYWQTSYPDSYHHCVLLDPLVPGQKYYYKVPSLGSDVYHFTAPPSLASGENVLFTILGDTQGAYNVQKRNIDNMVARHGIDGIDFTIVCGDNVNRDDDLGEWAMLYDSHSYGRIISQVPWMASSGNHETSSTSKTWPIRKNFKMFHQNSYINESTTVPSGARDIGVYYSFNYSNVHFTILDTHQLSTTSNLSVDQMAFLEDDLASVNATTMWKFLTFHVPMYSTSVRGGSDPEEDLARQLEPILRKYHVDAVFYGHDHVFESWHALANETYNGTYAFTVAGGGGSIKEVMDPDEHTNPLHAWDSNINIVNDYTDGRFDDIYGHEWQLYAEAVHHYMAVNVAGDVATFSAYRTIDNTLIKSYTVTR